jgi:hypothetical protein
MEYLKDEDTGLLGRAERRRRMDDNSLKRAVSGYVKAGYKVVGHRKTEPCPRCKTSSFCIDCGVCSSCHFCCDPKEAATLSKGTLART